MNVRTAGILLTLLLCACGSEPEPAADSGTDAGDVPVEVNPSECTTPDPSLTCMDAGCDEGLECVSDPASCAPSSCFCSEGSWGCSADCGPSFICVSETTPLPACGTLTDLGECEGVGTCEWVEPAGCPDPNTYVLQTAGCFPQSRCEGDADCPTGYICESSASVAPRCAWEEPLCDACGDVRPLCVPAE